MAFWRFRADMTPLLIAGVGMVLGCTPPTFAGSAAPLSGDAGTCEVNPQSCEESSNCGSDKRCPLIPVETPSPVDQCAEVNIKASLTIPEVILVIDQSGSMRDNFLGEGVTRWDALRNALLGENGLVRRLHRTVSFGLVLYAGVESIVNNQRVIECPRLVTVNPEVGNYIPIGQSYTAFGGDGVTPTAEALSYVLDHLITNGAGEDGGHYIVLATDGEPNGCGEETPVAMAKVVRAAAQGFKQGVKTFVVSVGNEIGEAHLRDVAAAGSGRFSPQNMQRGTDYWVGTDIDGLEAALRSAVAPRIPCKIEVNGNIVLDKACSASVRVGDKWYQCQKNDAKNGWRALDESHIELRGAACEALRNGTASSVAAAFPCGSIVPLAI